MEKNKKTKQKVEIMEENIGFELDIQEDNTIPLREIPKEIKEYSEANKYTDLHHDVDNLVSCLKRVTVIARIVHRDTDKYSNPKHVLYGGMAEGIQKQYTVPMLSSGMYVNVLTDSEKSFLEYTLGLEKNALSIYKKKDNFWDNFMVALGKEDNYFNLSDPMDYIKYKVLLANKDFICPSLEELANSPKATYRYVLFTEGEADKKSKQNMSNTMKAYKEFGKIEDDKDKLKLILEIILQKPIAPNTKLDWIQTEVNKIIQVNNKTFLKVLEDPYLDNKVLIKKAVERGIISNRGGYYYDKLNDTPLCGDGESPTLSTASKYLAHPKNQEYKFNIQAKLQTEE